MRRADRRRYHILYKTTCVVTGKYYIGMHSTDDLNDGYLGSGKRIKLSLNKYGPENHTFVILEYLNSREDLKKREVEVVNIERISDPLCMNIVTGGTGGWEIYNSNSELQKQKSLKSKLKQKYLSENDSEWLERTRKNKREALIKSYKDGTRVSTINQHSFKGKHHSENSKKKIGDANRGKLTGDKNPSYGMMWITDGVNNTRILKDSIIPEGWYKGRKI